MQLRSIAPAALFVFTCPAIAQTSPHLIPLPREYKAGAVLSLANGLRLTCQQPCAPEDASALAELRDTLAARGIALTEAPSAPHVFVARFSTPLGRQTYQDSLTPRPASAPTALPAAFTAEGYAIIPDRSGDKDSGLALTADTAAGIFYALQSVKQLVLDAAPPSVPQPTLQLATIRDWPAMKYRGLHDDLSRGPIPTLAFQKKLIRTLAAYKVNLYSPYFESTQQYPSNPLPAVPGASLSVADARELVAYAAPFHVTIVPEQEAIGHLRHMLVNEQFADVVETPHGAVIAPGQPGSLPLLHGMFSDLASIYPGPFLHIGGDETFELGYGRTKPDVDARGLAPVYLDFLQRIVADLQPLNRKLIFWGDVAQDAPALVKALPASVKSQLIADAWGYSPNPKGFDKQILPFLNAGLEVWVSPSINNYRQIWPNQQLALDDIQQFTRDGQRLGATGQLNTLWNDDGESLANMNWYGILFGAATAWQKGESSIHDFQQSFGSVFHGDSTGLINKAHAELTAAMSLLEDNKVVSHTEGTNGLFWVDPWSRDGQVFATRMRPVSSALRLHAESAITLIARARSANTSLRESDAIDAMDFAARRLDFLGLSFQLSDEIVSGYARAQATAAGDWRKAHPGVASLLSDINSVNGRLQDLTYGLSLLRDGNEQQWLRSNRPANLRPILARYDLTTALWLARIDKFRAAQRQWSESHTLPSATDLGLPTSTPPQPPSH